VSLPEAMTWTNVVKSLVPWRPGWLIAGPTTKGVGRMQEQVWRWDIQPLPNSLRVDAVLCFFSHGEGRNPHGQRAASITSVSEHVVLQICEAGQYV
jgi:hypothetical protein